MLHPLLHLEGLLDVLTHHLFLVLLLVFLDTVVLFRDLLKVVDHLSVLSEFDVFLEGKLSCTVFTVLEVLELNLAFDEFGALLSLIVVVE